MTLYIRVVGDTNDADYISEFNPVSHMHLKLIDKVAAALKTVGPYEHNWPTSEYSRGTNFYDLYIADGLLTEEELDTFGEHYVPWGDCGIHSIESIELMEVTNLQRLY